MNKQYRIGIDARFYGTLGKGLGRYTQELISRLEKIDSCHEYVIFLGKENFDEYIPNNPRFTKVLADVPWYGWLEQIKMPIILYRHKLDLVHFPHFNVPVFYFKKFVVTIHDLILLRYPTVQQTTLSRPYYWFKFFVYTQLLGYIILRAKKIIAVSRYTKNDIISFFPFSRKKIHVTYQSLNDLHSMNSHSMDEDAFPQDVSKRKPYFLYVGNAYPHKNLQRLLMAFSRVNGGVNLVIVGKRDFFSQRLEAFVREKNIANVIFLDTVSDAELRCLYKRAKAFIFPSLYEGFGLPPLEAMAQGTLVISSNRTSMPEVLGDAALFFDPESEQEMIASMERVMSGAVSFGECIKKGLKRAQVFHQNAAAEETLRVYQEAIAG